MKFSLSSLVALAAAASVADAHTIFQKVSVNGVDQGSLKGVRAPDSNNPIEDVNHADFACNTGITHKDSTIINIPAGAKVGSWWGHVIGGAQYAGDVDNPIAASHKGPITVWLAKVDNAATASGTGQKWFKVAEEGLSGGKWAVDNMYANGGWHYFTMPSCVAPGNYLMRVELLALHSAGNYPGAQFYQECAQINISGSGTSTGSNLVSFPGAYTGQEPGIKISIYGSDGQPNNGGKAYTIPGPAVLTCGAGSTTPPKTTLVTSVRPATSTSKPAAAASSTKAASSPVVVPAKTSSVAAAPAPSATKPATGGAGAGLYGQCGGIGWTGPTTCAAGTCKKQNDWYSQCL